MKILIAPLAMPLPAPEPGARLASLASEVLLRGHSLAVCAPREGFLQVVEGAKQYAAPAPSLLGLPGGLACLLGFLRQLSWVRGRMRVTSFEHVLHLGGMLRKKFIAADVLALRQAIEDFKPDVVFSEFRYTAVLAAKLIGVPIASTHSFPTQTAYAANPEYSGELRAFLAENGLPECESALEIFEWADLRCVPSSQELEPVQGENIMYVGPLSRIRRHAPNLRGPRKNIVISLDSGVLRLKKAVQTAVTLFKDGPYDVFIAGKGLAPKSVGRVEVREFFDCNELLPQAALFVNHGGADSVLPALACGVPQLICPGHVFERRYHADTLATRGAAKKFIPQEFVPGILEVHVRELVTEPSYAEQAAATGAELFKLGGAGKVLDLLEERFA